MESHETQPSVHTLMAVVDDFTLTEAPAAVPCHFKLCVGDGEYSVATWLGEWMLNDLQHVDVARVTLIPCSIDRDVRWVATRIDYRPEDSLIALIPDSFGADHTIVQRFRDVLARIESEPLANMISRTWSLKKVFRDFWTCPASQAHHHAWRGGLAAHSVEMAEWVADTPGLSATDRDIGIAYALLHDLGKLWCYSEDGHENMQRLGHELIGFAKLGDALSVLDNEWTDGAIAMRSLLSGTWKTKGQKPVLAVGKLVQAYDQRSAEADMRGREGHRYQAWTPTPHASNVRPFPGRQ